MTMSAIKQIIRESKIAAFLSNFTSTFLFYFYNSLLYRFFKKANSAFFGEVILKNANRSLIIKTVRGVFNHLKRRDLGLFIVLTVLFNTALMAFLRKNVDMFSLSARTAFFIFGLVLIFKKNGK